MLRFSGAGVSDVGLVRPQNEDSAFVGPYVAVVADGVGGAAAGEVASATAAYAVAATVLGRPGEQPEELLLDGLEAARANIRRGVQGDLTRLGMATTLTAVVCDGRRAVLAHIGDSRAYVLRGGELTRLTTDHTYVQRLVSQGELRPEEVIRHPWRNVVLRSLDGDPVHDGVDLLPLAVQPGDRLLLCSDGLSDLVPEPVIGELLAVADPHSAAAVLTRAALDAGGRDNVTAVVLDVVEGPMVVGDGQLLGALREVANIVDPGAVRLAQ
ncbi:MULTISPECIES: protein phosphatase 2C domain-containing protein [unclassified Nocardioides]|uniref:PP2C family protein-serine/threonine phosphatase n=1 Tax=unclassified Nocardioides TaxID=2615069 RepID=UPI0000570875|nr:MULTISPECIES: protein phosphatase 2C domain-containing protein [unclassified Nocardioides]ABL81492.1 protein phosphatase 2C domain protein [Nocardioides sp. JS614]